MSNFKRQAIVSIAAIAGAQIANLVLSPASPVQSSSCLQWASESISAAQQNMQYAVNPPPNSEGTGYYDVRTKRDEPTFPVGHYQAAAPAPTAVAEPVARTETVPLSATTPSVSPSVEMSIVPGLTQNVLGTGMSQTEWDAKRRTMPRSTTKPQSTTNYSCAWYKGKKYCGEG